MESRWLLFGVVLFVGFIGIKRVFFETGTNTIISNVTTAKYDRSATVPGITKTGPIEGFVHTTDGGVKANVFLGIPYAKPPVGELRFERPQPPDPWIKPLTTKYFQKACVPFTREKLHGGIETVSEDCLYLNVMTPINVKKNDKRAVLVYIHGGGFNFGDCIRAGFDKYVTNFVSRGLIVVTMSYRVGLYGGFWMDKQKTGSGGWGHCVSGFFSTGDSVAEGNNGLWDQVAALKWIHENIGLFGGDPNSVTVFGQSAGSTSADILALAPPSRDYIQKVIQASGSAAHHWSINNNDPVAGTMKVLHALGFYSNNSTEIKAFLKTQTVARVLDASSTSDFVSDFLDDRFSKKFLCFGPRIDKDFFDGKTIEQLITEAPPKPNLMGLMVNESGPFLLFNLPPSKLATYSRNHIIKYINESIPYSQAGPETEPLRQEFINRYVDNLPVPSANVAKHWHDQHVRLLSEYMFVASVMAEIHQKYDEKWPVYLYTWNHVSDEFKAQTGVAGAFHAYDLWYISDEHPFPDTHGPMELIVQDVYAEMVSRFAISGNPSSNGLKFPRFSKWKQRVFWIDPKPSIRKNVFIKANAFYDYLEEEYDYSVRRGVKKSLRNES